jgi:hypothetical protein
MEHRGHRGGLLLSCKMGKSPCWTSFVTFQTKGFRWKPKRGSSDTICRILTMTLLLLIKPLTKERISGATPGCDIRKRDVRFQVG